MIIKNKEYLPYWTQAISAAQPWVFSPKFRFSPNKKYLFFNPFLTNLLKSA